MSWDFEIFADVKVMEAFHVFFKQVIGRVDIST